MAKITKIETVKEGGIVSRISFSGMKLLKHWDAAVCRGKQSIWKFYKTMTGKASNSWGLLNGIP